jgi:hypothetical protein
VWSWKILVAEEGMFSKKTWWAGGFSPSPGWWALLGPVAGLGGKTSARWTEEAWQEAQMVDEEEDDVGLQHSKSSQLLSFFGEQK